MATEECTRWACEGRRALFKQKGFSCTCECIETLEPATEFFFLGCARPASVALQVNNCQKFSSRCRREFRKFSCETVEQVLRLWWRWSHCARFPNARSAVKASVELVTSGAIASAGNETTQLCEEVVIDGVRIADALIDTGSSLSMLSTATYCRLPSTPAIQPFTGAAPVVVGVGGARAEIRGYVDAPVELDGIAVHHPLLVVDGLAFALLIGMDVLRPHGATLSFDGDPVRLRTRVCKVCRERRTNPSAESRCTPLTACATQSHSQSQPHSQSSGASAASVGSAPPADFSACAPDCTHTGISPRAPSGISHGFSSCPSRCRSKQHGCTCASAPPTVAHARRVRGADLEVEVAASANLARRARKRFGCASCAETHRRNTCASADREDSAVHCSFALALSVACGRIGCFLLHGCNGCSLKHEAAHIVQP